MSWQYVWLHEEKKACFWRGAKFYNIEIFLSAIDPSLVRYNLLVLHVFFGNNCTSAFFNPPSYNALKINWQHLTTELEIFKDMNATKDDIHDAGVKLVLTMYGCDINHYFQRSQ